MASLQQYLDESPAHIKGEWVFAVCVNSLPSTDLLSVVQSLKSKSFSFKDVVKLSRSLDGVSKSDLFEAFHDD